MLELRSQPILPRSEMEAELTNKFLAILRSSQESLKESIILSTELYYDVVKSRELEIKCPVELVSDQKLPKKKISWIGIYDKIGPLSRTGNVTKIREQFEVWFFVWYPLHFCLKWAPLVHAIKWFKDHHLIH